MFHFLFVGKAVGIVTLLRGLPHTLSRGQIYLPQDLTTEVDFCFCGIYISQFSTRPE